jgi:hypothetical protein
VNGEHSLTRKVRDDKVSSLKVQLNTAHPPSNPHLRAHYTNLGAISALLSRPNAPPPPLSSDVNRAELEALSLASHPLARYQKLLSAGDLNMDRLLALLHSPALKLESVVDVWATKHSIPAAHVVLKLCKLQRPNKELLSKWMGLVPSPRVTIARAKVLGPDERQGHRPEPHPYEQFSLRQLSVDLAAQMTYALQKRGPLWNVFLEWLEWKEALVPGRDLIDLRDGSHTHVLFMPTILLLRAVTERGESQAILDAVLPLVTLPPRSPHTKNIFNRILECEEWMSDPLTATNVLFSASVYRPSLQFAEFVGIVVPELLKRPEILQDHIVQERVSTLVDMALEDCGLAAGEAGGGSDLTRNELERAGREIAKIVADKKGKQNLHLPGQLCPTY